MPNKLPRSEMNDDTDGEREDARRFQPTGVLETLHDAIFRERAKPKGEQRAALLNKWAGEIRAITGHS